MARSTVVSEPGQVGSHTLALSSEGKVYAWGSNFYGQLGDNTTTRRLAPVATNASGAWTIPNVSPGGYTVQVAGADGGTGEGLIEIYELP